MDKTIRDETRAQSSTLEPVIPPETLVLNIDAFIPPEMAARAGNVGVLKATMGWRNMMALAVLAGAFIALGAIFFTTVTTGAAGQLPYGLVRLVGGLAFCLGLILVVVAGAELFTGNNLIVMAWADGRLSTVQVLRNWLIVFFGNFVGSLTTAGFMFLTEQYTFGGNAIGLNILTIANAKCNLGFLQALTLGVMCNALVCLAVWLCYSARSTTDKILSILFPITAFVAAGFEHNVANMYFISIGLLVKAGAPPAFWESVGRTAAEYPNLTWGRFFLASLLPVTIGNVIGGAVMVGLVYWFIYTRKASRTTTATR